MSPEGRTIALVSIASAVSSLDLSLMFVAYPAIRADFPDVSLTLVSWVLTSFTIVAAALLIPAGRLADRVGRKKVFLASLLFFSGGSALCAVAPTVPIMITARVIQAVGGAMLTPSALAIIMTTLPVERRSWGIGTWSTINGAVATAAPTIGAALVRYASWRWAFLINVPIGVGCYFVGRRVLEESFDPDAGPLPDPLGVVVITAAISMLAFGIVQSSAWGWTDRGTLLALGGAVVLLAVFLHRCAHHPAPVIDLRVFKPFLFKANAVTALAMGAALWGGYYIFIQFLSRAWAFTILATGLLLIPMTLSASVVGVPAGRLMDRRGHRPVMIPAALVFTASLLWLALGSGDERQVLLVWMPAAIGVGVANAICFPGVNSAGAMLAPQGSLGITAGIIQTLIRIGGVTGTALGIALVGDLGPQPSAGDFHPAFFAFAAIGVIALVTILPLSNKPAATPPAVLAGDAGTLTAS